MTDWQHFNWISVWGINFECKQKLQCDSEWGAWKRESSKSMNEGETFNSCYEEGFQEVYGDAIRACYHDDESSIKRVH